MGKKKSEQKGGFEDYEELEKIFDKIEKKKEWVEWFGTPCKKFAPLCPNCCFWNRWEKFKQDTFKEACS